MYPNLLSTSYFVPAAYFYKLRYKTQTVAGQVIYLPDPPEENYVRHDQAVQHILHCLRRMAENQQMFVLTQFKYDDYFNDRRPASSGEPMPVSSDLKATIKECFDFLIIHRNYGVHVGVVKSISDKVDCTQDGKGKTDKQLVSAVSEAIKQLKMADHIVQHLLLHKEKEKIPPVKLTLMIPNVRMSSLHRVLASHNKVARVGPLS